MRKWALLAFAAAALLAIAWGPVNALGFASGLYSRADSGCNGNVSDPIGIVFAGTAASADNMSKEIIRHGGWPFRGVGIGGDSQYANVYKQKPSTTCEPNKDGLTSYPFGEFGNDRYHIRIWPTWQEGGMPKTVGTPHWERLVQCLDPTKIGHAVLGYGAIPGSPGESGFEFARHKLKQNFVAAGHQAGSMEWGNDIAVQQCNGWVAANGDGYVALVYVNHVAP